MEVKPIPAFYCCYLLRSTVRHASVYVGSTPAPVRRLAQHNGLSKGGAVRTSRLSLRPWEMTCLVSGFKSQVAALQFEWAWQNPHLTRHIAADERISFPTNKTKMNAKTGRARKRPGRPSITLRNQLANLYLLLRSPSFSKWPLQVRFFNQDAYHAWQDCCEAATAELPDSIPVIVDLQQDGLLAIPSSSQREARKQDDEVGLGGIQGLDTTYASYRHVLEKSQFLIADSEDLRCAVCHGPMKHGLDLIVVCSSDSCNALSHVACLSKHFLRDQGPRTIIPDKGKCPGCQTNLDWSDLVTEMTLRLRAPKQVQKVLKKKRKGVPPSAMLEETEVDEDDEVESEDPGLTAVDVAKLGGDLVGEPDSDSDTASVASSMAEVVAERRASFKLKGRKRRLSSVVEESDWEGAELIE